MSLLQRWVSASDIALAAFLTFCPQHLLQSKCIHNECFFLSSLYLENLKPDDLELSWI